MSDAPDPNEIWERCPGCGAEHTAGSLRRDSEGRVRCPECADSVFIEARRVRQVLETIEAEASSHGSNYAAGMRRARIIAEIELLEYTRVDEDVSRYRSDE